MKNRPSAVAVKIERFKDGQRVINDDLLAVEEPLEIRMIYDMNGQAVEKAISVTMRTPGNDLELAAGYLFTEGIIQNMSQVKMIRHCINDEHDQHPENIVKVEMKPEIALDLSSLTRNFYMTSSCGICGKASIEQIETTSCYQINKDLPGIDIALINQLPETLRQEQTVFKHTGGIHAAALFNPEGELLIMKEDIGRHNAVDKLIGSAFMKNMLPLSNHIILFSGRASFELVQKSAMAGIPVMAAVGAPSSLAAETADKFGMTLCGFVRDNRFNVYSGFSRIPDF